MTRILFEDIMYEFEHGDSWSTRQKILGRMRVLPGILRDAPEMEDGTYDRKIDFKAFKCEKFVPHLFVSRSFCGCGATALGVLTGVDPSNLPTKKDWTSRFMISYLHKKGFQTAKLTKKNLTGTKWTTYPVGSNHVSLISIKLIKHQASWIVVHNYKTYHNFEVSDFNAYELMNHPIVTMYLVKHPSWDKTVPV